MRTLLLSLFVFLAPLPVTVSFTPPLPDPLIYDNPPDEELFINPVSIPVLLSGNFGEIRSDHFHSGIDIRTRGETGHNIIAAASGYVYRIAVSPGGFGKALYLRHPTGYSTVYAHLDSFTPEIEEYILQQQYRNRSFSVNLFPPAGRFTFRQGDLIALSGNTGSSQGPHLHFEIRRSDGEIPRDPLRYLSGIKDNIKPIMQSLAVYPATQTTSVNGTNECIVIPVRGSDGNYYIDSAQPLAISGKVGFGIQAYDLLNDSWNRCGVNSIELEIDGKIIYRFVIDEFSFGETRYINSHKDYRRRIRDNITIQQTFVAPNDRLSTYRDVINRGLYSFAADTLHNVKITATDTHGNSSVLTFQARSLAEGELPITSGHDAINNGNSNGEHSDTTLFYNGRYIFEEEDFRITIMPNTFYDNVPFSLTHEERIEGLYSDIYTAGDRFTPLHRAVEIEIRPNKVPAALKEKLAIVSPGANGSLRYVGGEWHGDYLKVSVRNFGIFSVAADTIPPRVESRLFRDGADLSGRKEINFIISDDLSGIGSYEAFINDQWVLFEYDAKNNLITCNLEKAPIEKGNTHQLLLKVTDNRNNVTAVEGSFIW